MKKQKWNIDEKTKRDMISKSLLLQAIEEEMMRPESERDMDFINDCFEDIERLNAPSYIEPEKLEKPERHYVRIPRWAAVACTLIMALLIGTGIAEACGVRVWKALFSWDAKYLNINYKTEDEEAVPTSFGSYLDEENNIDESDTIETDYYSNINTAVGDFGMKVMLPGELPQGYEIEEISIIDMDIVRTLVITYVDKEDSRITFEVSYHYGEGVVTTLFDTIEQEEIEVFEYDGIDYTLIKNSDNIFWAEWMTDSNVSYRLYSTEDVDTVKNIIFNMEKEKEEK